MSKKVSIIIPVYNGSDYLKESIDSALAQDYENVEVIVVNDGSTDNGKTKNIAMSYGKKIRYFEKKNGGVASALNLGISKMTGEYFSWLSHDDRYKKDKISAQIKYLHDNNMFDKEVILYADFDVIDKKSKYLWTEKKEHSFSINKPEYLLLRGQINGITVLIPKGAFERCGLFNEDLLCTQDYDLWYRMSKVYKFVHMEKVTSETRMHPKQTTNCNPAVKSEGNKFWTSIIKNLTKKDMIRLEGSEYGFYSEMLDFLKDSLYDETINYCKEKVENIKNSNKFKDDIEKYNKRKKESKEETKKSYTNNKNIFSKLYLSIHTVGVKPTIKRIFNKLKK